MKFRCRMCDIFNIQHFHRIMQTIAKVADPLCVVRITPTRLFLFTKASAATGGWIVSAELRSDLLFDEFQMIGYGPDINEIYFEVNAAVLLHGLKVPAVNAKVLKMKLTNKLGPCLCIEAELPSQSTRSRLTVFDVPIVVIHRQLWQELTPPDDMPFNVSCYLPVFKIFKGVIDRMKALGQYVEASVNKQGELKVRIGEPSDVCTITSHFADLEVPTVNAAVDFGEDFRKEEEEIMLNHDGWFSVIVDLRRLSAFLGAQQFSSTRIRCDLRHHQYLQLTIGTEEMRLRFILPASDA